MMQMPLFTPDSDWRPPSMGDMPDWTGAKRVAVDCETKDPQLKQLGPGVRRDGHVVGVSFALEDGPKHYLPFRHAGGDNLDEAQVLAYLRAQAGNYKGQIVGANLSYDLDYLAEEEVLFSKTAFFRDIQVADPLIYELHNSYSLAAIAERNNMPGKDEALLEEAARAYGVSPKGGMWQLPSRFVGAYAEQDAALPLQLLRRQEKKIDELDLWSIWNLESKVLPVLVKLRRRGVRIDQDKLSQIEDWSLQREAEALQLVKDQTGVNIGVGNVWKAQALAPALEEIGIKLQYNTKKQPSIDQAVLAGANHPVAEAIARARKVNKLRTTFAASIRRYMVKGRIHCSFNQMRRESESGDQKGARYGRLSCVDPNMQQQPSRDEFAAMWRSIYVPEEGALWGCNDYSQQEPRWTTHFAALMDFPKAQAAAQAYWDDPTLDNHQFMAELTGLPRKQAKNVYLGVCYGEGGAKLCNDLGLPTRWAVRFKQGRRGDIRYFPNRQEAMAARTDWEGEAYMWEAAGEEGQHVLDTFDKRAPFIRKLAKFAEKRVKNKGQIKTVGGRVLHFPQRQDGSYDWCHKALNRLIQGSSADQTKMAMVAIDEQMPDSFIQLQVHDEIDGSFANKAEAQKVANIMQECIPGTKVPFRVDVEVGPSWGEVE